MKITRRRIQKARRRAERLAYAAAHKPRMVGDLGYPDCDRCGAKKINYYSARCNRAGHVIEVVCGDCNDAENLATWDANKRLTLFEALDGRHYTLDGVSGVLKHETISARYPYPHTDHTLSHAADAKGKRSAKYIELRDRLRDDWSTDITNSERLDEIARRLRIDVDGLLRQSKRGG